MKREAGLAFAASRGQRAEGVAAPPLQLSPLPVGGDQSGEWNWRFRLDLLLRWELQES